MLRSFEKDPPHFCHKLTVFVYLTFVVHMYTVISPLPVILMFNRTIKVVMMRTWCSIGELVGTE